MLDFYKMLNIPRNATMEEIKSSYKKLAVKYHPDKNPGDIEAEKQFISINEANETLSDPDKRKRYDAKTSMTFGFGFFRDLFDDGIKRKNVTDFDVSNVTMERPKGDDISSDIYVTLEEVFNGTSKELRVKRKISCRICNGSGAATTETCSVCNGFGYIFKNKEDKGAIEGDICNQCFGSGVQTEDECEDCTGKGYDIESCAVQVIIPKGVSSDDVLTVPGKGDAGKKAGPYGDMKVRVHILNHKIFTKNELNLTCKIDVSVTDLILGCSVKIPTLELDPVEMIIPPLTKHDATFRIKNKGLTNKIGDIKGNILVSLNLIIPESISDDCKSLYEQIRKNESFDLK